MTVHAAHAAHAAHAGPAWLRDEDERPHTVEDLAGWSENYLAYVHDPDAEVAAWFHISSRPPLWQETMLVALPGDEFLAAKAIAPGRPGDGVEIAGLAYTFDEPFGEWTISYRGGARRVAGAELRSGPLADGAHVPVTLDLRCRPLSPPFDFGRPQLDQEWGSGHYEVHQEVTGTIALADQTLEVAGTGLRDHSWGSRDYARIGTTTWIHGQFPSGRHLMVVQVTGVEGAEPFSHCAIGDAESSRVATVAGIPAAGSLADTAAGYELAIEGSPVRARVTRTLPMALIGAAEIGIGTHSAPAANHHYVEGLTRFEWNGEAGFGITERSVDLTVGESER